MVIACAEGGTSIEDLAESNPDAIVRVPIDPKIGMTDADAATVVAGHTKALGGNDQIAVAVTPMNQAATGRAVIAPHAPSGLAMRD